MEEAVKYVDFDSEKDWIEVKPIIKAFCFPNKWYFGVDGEGNRTFTYDLSERYNIKIASENPLQTYMVELVARFDAKGKWSHKRIYSVDLEKFDLEIFKTQLRKIEF